MHRSRALEIDGFLGDGLIQNQGALIEVLLGRGRVCCSGFAHHRLGTPGTPAFIVEG
jgi:hypothetical protein